jgi:outer membrane protein TolC
MKNTIKRIEIYLFPLFLTCIFINASHAQDSLKVFTIKDFLSVVSVSHPVVQQASMLSEQARMDVRLARGMFDPKISSSYYDKYFKGKEYYNVWKNELSVPVYVGDVKVGYERNEGAYLNPENQTGANGYTSVGYVVPIGNGLLTDERRTTLKQAQAMQTATEAERVKLINKILLSATKDYWDWYFTYHQYKLNEESLELVRFRLQSIIERVNSGDLPSIDTVEARVQEQWIFQAYTQAFMNFQNATITMSNNLWDPNGSPIIAQGIMPTDSFLTLTQIPVDSLDALLVFAKVNHPEVIKAEQKVNYYELEKKLAVERLRPQLDLGAYWLQNGFFEEGNISQNNYLSDNHMFKANFSYPLFLRKERAKYKLSKIKMDYAKLDLQMTNRDVQNTIQQQYNELLMLRKQLMNQEQLVLNLSKMREGEQTKYLIGESTLFVLNQRDQFLLKEKIKYREIKSKFAKSLVSLQWAAGKVQF